MSFVVFTAACYKSVIWSDFDFKQVENASVRHDFKFLIFHECDIESHSFAEDLMRFAIEKARAYTDSDYQVDYLSGAGGLC
jgi:heterodisulfide reductase subunit A-like polyferredoxin